MVVRAKPWGVGSDVPAGARVPERARGWWRRSGGQAVRERSADGVRAMAEVSKKIKKQKRTASPIGNAVLFLGISISMYISYVKTLQVSQRQSKHRR